MNLVPILDRCIMVLVNFVDILSSGDDIGEILAGKLISAASFSRKATARLLFDLD